MLLCSCGAHCTIVIPPMCDACFEATSFEDEPTRVDVVPMTLVDRNADWLVWLNAYTHDDNTEPTGIPADPDTDEIDALYVDEDPFFAVRGAPDGHDRED